MNPFCTTVFSPKKENPFFPALLLAVNFLQPTSAVACLAKTFFLHTWTLTNANSTYELYTFAELSNNCVHVSENDCMAKSRRAQTSAKLRWISFNFIAASCGFDSWTTKLSERKLTAVIKDKFLRSLFSSYVKSFWGSNIYKTSKSLSSLKCHSTSWNNMKPAFAVLWTVPMLVALTSQNWRSTFHLIFGGKKFFHCKIVTLPTTAYIK